jgi:hypothetical protein
MFKAFGPRIDFTLITPIEQKAEGGFLKDGEGEFYIGKFRSKPNGRGSTLSLDGRTLFEGFSLDGAKHGPYRSIEMSSDSPLVTITEGIYDQGELVTFAQTLVHVVY